MRVVKVHTTERYEAGRFGRINKEVLRQQLKVRTARAISGPIAELVTMFALGGLTIVAAKLILDGGDLIIHWDETNDHVIMTGPVELEQTLDV